jgi:hypothetical protein
VSVVVTRRTSLSPIVVAYPYGVQACQLAQRLRQLAGLRHRRIADQTGITESRC